MFCLFFSILNKHQIVGKLVKHCKTTGTVNKTLNSMYLLHCLDFMQFALDTRYAASFLANNLNTKIFC